MKKKIFALTSFLILVSSCSHSPSNEGTVTDITGPQTFMAEFDGNLNVGDKILIIEKEKVHKGIHDEPRSEVPYNTEKKVVIGKGVVSTVLDSNHYEFKSEKPQHIPGDAIIQKL